MNIAAWLFGTTTMVLGVVCLFLLMQQPGEPAQRGALHEPDKELQTELAQLRAERDRLETVVHSLRAAQFDPTPVVQSPAAVPAPPPTVAAPMLQRPEFSARNRRHMIRVRNAKLFRQLGLSEAEVESLLDLLVVQEERMFAAKPGALLSADPELRTRNRAEVEALIGSARAEKLDSWQAQSMTRMELRRVRDQLDDLGEPLSDAQLSRLSDLVQARPAAAPPVRQPDESPEAYSARWKSWRSESRDLMRESAKAVLEPRQMQSYNEMDEVARSMDRSLPMMATSALPGPPQSAGAAAPLPPR